MTEQTNQLASLFAACWKDEALKADPKAVLAEYDMPVADGMDMTVVENAGNCVHITMPAAPASHLKRSDKELSDAKGVVRTTLDHESKNLFAACCMWSWSPAC